MKKRIIALFSIITIVFTGILPAYAEPVKEKASDYIYYAGQTFKVMRVKKDCTENKALTNDYADGVRRVGDWVYYVKQERTKTDDGKILYSNFGEVYKVKFDGTGRTLVIKDKIYRILITDKYIFYTVDNQKLSTCSVYRVDLNGKGKVKIFNKDVWFVGTDNKWIYYTDQVEYKLYKMDLQGKNSVRMTNDLEIIKCDLLVGGKIDYYSCKTGFNIMDTDSKNKIKVENENGIGFCYKAGRIYRLTNAYGRVVSSELDGKNEIVLAKNVLDIIYVDNSNIYYIDGDKVVHKIEI